MAIRSGTGGLKYPLPANTDIQASIAAASSGGSAASSAYGANRQFAANRMRVQADLANSAAERQFRALSQMAGQQFQAQQRYFDREHQKGSQLEAQRFDAEQQAARLQQQREMQWQDQYFTTERDRQLQGFQTERDQARFEQDQIRFEREIDAGIEADIRSGNLELSPAAQQELQKLEEARTAARDLDPTQQAEFEQQYQNRRREILRSARPPQGPSATGRAQQQTTYYDPQTGSFSDQMGPGRIPGMVNEKGGFEPIVAQPDTSKEDAKQRVELEKRAREIKQERNPATGKPYTSEDAMKRAIEEMAEEQAGFDKALRPPESAQSGMTTGPAAVQKPDGTWGGAIFDRDAALKNIGQLPVPKSEAEMKALPPGALFLKPNGEIGKAPAASQAQAQGQQFAPLGGKDYVPGSAWGGIRHESEFTPRPGSGWKKQGEFWVNTGSIDLSGDKRFEKRGDVWVNVEEEQKRKKK